jgi:hypothetical protein
VYYNFFRWVIHHFVGGDRAPDKFLKPTVYSAPAEFRAGVFDGLMDGDGHFEFAAQRDTFCSTSHDLASFVLRHAREQGWSARLSRTENETLGSWRVRFDRSVRSSGLLVESVVPCGTSVLVDIAIEDPHLFLIANGTVTHNCTMGMGYHYRKRHEYVLFFEKGKRKLNDLGVPDIIEVGRVRNGYPTEKPHEVSEVLINQSSQEGEVVIDPFMGSGSAGVAALKNGRVFLGCDIKEAACDLANSNLVEAAAGGTWSERLYRDRLRKQGRMFGGAA